MNRALNLLIRSRLALAGSLHWRTFQRQLSQPAATQERTLRDILQRHRATRFGREHGFAEIKTPADYAARVPVSQYEDLRPYIERQERERTPELTVDRPVMYARTSGTTGKPKDIPILADTIRRYRRNQQLFAYCHHRAIPGLYEGKSLAFVSPAIEGRLPGGTPYGSMSGLVYQSMPTVLRSKYVLPAAVFGCADYGLKYLLIATLAAAEREVSYIGTANPSTLLKFADVVRENWDTIVAGVATGDLPGCDQLEPDLRRVIRAQLHPNPVRAAELRALAADSPATGVAVGRLWPHLKALTCWGEGSCALLLPALKAQLPPGVPVLELGYLASECRGTLPCDPERSNHVPTLHDNYFEFAEREAWESGNRSTRMLPDLETGCAYYVIVTAANGLYRYFMNDLVEVDGWHGPTPTLRFLEKGSGMTNITGEKLHENHVCAAMTAMWRESGHDAAAARFFVVVAEPDRLRYTLYLETGTPEARGVPADFAARFDAELAALNLEYKAKRDSARLHPVELRLLRPGTGSAYQGRLVELGQREAQFKYTRLQTRARLGFDFDAHALPPP